MWGKKSNYRYRFCFTCSWTYADQTQDDETHEETISADKPIGDLVERGEHVVLLGLIRELTYLG